MIINKKAVLTTMLCLGMAIFAGCGSSSADINVSEGMAKVKAMDYEGALDCFGTALDAGENSRLVYRGMGLAYMGLTDYEKAIDNFVECLNLSDGFIQDIDFDVNYYLATAYYKNGNIREAADTYTAILNLRPDETESYLLRGTVLLALDEYQNAQKDFDIVLSGTDYDCDNVISIYQALEEHGYQEIGRNYLQKTLEEKGDSLKDYDRGRIYYYMRDYVKACTYLEKSRDTGTAESYLYLGKAYEATGDYNYASSLYTSYVAEDTTNAGVYNQLGLCRLKQGEYEQALEAFQAAMNIEGNGMQQTLRFNEIVAYEYMGEFKKAAVLMDNYIKTYPDDETAKREYEFLRTR